MDELQRRFLLAQRVLRLSTVDTDGQPYLVPICFALDGDTLYSAIDEKPKSTAIGLRRLRNVAANPRVALLADQYDDTDWSRLGYLLLLGRARTLVSGPQHARALAL